MDQAIARLRKELGDPSEARRGLGHTFGTLPAGVDTAAVIPVVFPCGAEIKVVTVKQADARSARR